MAQKNSMIFLSYVKMHFSYVKSKFDSKILCSWLNIFTPKIHPPPTYPV